MASNIILAIDPGTTGSACMLVGLELHRVMSFAHTREWWNDLYSWCLIDRPDQCVIENVHSFSGQGVTTTAKFMNMDGIAFGAVAVTGVPVKRADPRVWQRRLGLPLRNEIPERTKRRAQLRKDQKAFALQMFPQLKEWDKGAIRFDTGKKEKPDIWGSVCIGYAGMLDLLGVPLGQLV